jgi:hypothetical protein
MLPSNTASPHISAVCVLDDRLGGHAAEKSRAPTAPAAARAFRLCDHFCIQRLYSAAFYFLGAVYGVL